MDVISDIIDIEDIRDITDIMDYPHPFADSNFRGFFEGLTM